MNKPFLLLALITGAFLPICAPAAESEIFNTEEQIFRVNTLVRDLEQPWGMAFLPDGGMLITEKAGRLRRVQDGRLRDEPVQGLPDVAVKGQGGLMDVALDPGFENNQLIYLSYAASGDDGYGTEVARGRLNGNRLEDVEVIFRALPKSGGGWHFGSRLLFAPDGKLFITLGERGIREQAQDLSTHPGSLIRINPDGSVPDDNPFVGHDDARPEIYTYGNRNIQGIAMQSGTQTIWMHEHGPQGGDEVNIVKAGTNYGWPVITYGVNYVIGTRIGEGTRKEGMAQPVHYWDPSIAPSGMTFYDGDKLPGWQGDLFVGSLKFGLIARLEVEDNEVVHEERLLENYLRRVRDIAQGPDGYLYILTDESSGELMRLEPVKGTSE